MALEEVDMRNYCGLYEGGIPREKAQLVSIAQVSTMQCNSTQIDTRG